MYLGGFAFLLDRVQAPLFLGHPGLVLRRRLPFGREGGLQGLEQNHARRDCGEGGGGGGISCARSWAPAVAGIDLSGSR